MKKHLRLIKGAFIFATLITLLMCPGLYAIEEALPTPEEIITKNIEAMGGKEAIDKIYNKKTVTITSEVETQITTGEFRHTYYSERPNKYYRSIDGRGRSGSNGKIAWRINRDGVARLLEGDQLSFALGQNLEFI